MKIIDTLSSKIDKTVKYVYNSNNAALEFSYINKDDGKDIICVPTQTTCNLGCKFCFLTDLKLPLKNLKPEEIVDGINSVVDRSNLLQSGNKVLLISFMGCGEPLCAIDEVIEVSNRIREQYSKHYEVVRFAVASLIPARLLFNKFEDQIIRNKLNCKFHYSLHTPDPVVRKDLMPGAAPISIDLVSSYIKKTNNSAEVHYSLMNGINDKDEDASRIITMLKGKSIPVKILRLSEKSTTEDLQMSKKAREFQALLEAGGIKTEYYEPPGNDIGASCGQFLLDYYKKI